MKKENTSIANYFASERDVLIIGFRDGFICVYQRISAAN